MASARIWQPPAGTHNVTIGPTMQAALESLDGPPSAPSLTEYYSVTYDYRPPSLDSRAAGKISATNEPQSDGLPSFKMQYGSAEAGDLHAFAGSQSQAKEFECVLIYDEATGEFTFERLDSVITLEYDRGSSSHATSRPLDNSPGSAGTVSSGSPPTPPNVAYNGFDNVQVADMNFDEDTEEIAPVASKPAPPSRPTHAAKSVMVVAPPERPERPAVPAKGKGKRNRDALAEKDPPARQPPAKRLPAPAAPRPPPPALPAAPLALPPRPPTPPSGLRSPNAYVPASDINVFDDEDDVPLLSKGFTLEVEENPVLPPAHRPFSEGLIEEEAPNIDTMFDGLDYDEEDGEAEGEDDDQEDDDDFRIDVDEVDQAPRGPPISMNDLAGGEDDDDDDEDDDEDESDEDSD